MRITAVETIRLPGLDNLIWLRLHTDAGLVGIGETFRGVAAVEGHVHADVARALIGTDPSRIDAISKRLLEPYVGYRSSSAEVRAASAVDIALWDLRGKELGRPVHELLGGLSRDRIRTYNTCAGYSYNQSGGPRQIGGDDQAAGPYDDQIGFLTDAGRLAESLLSEGITAMKIWPFDRFAAAQDGLSISLADLNRALEPFRQIRNTVGDRMDVMVEMHAMWSLPAALRIARGLREFSPYWLEDPVKMLDPDTLRAFAERADAPVCASETLGTRGQFLDLLRDQSVDYAKLDVSWCGGLSEAKKIATMAEAFQRPVAPHDCTGPIVFAASIHLAMNAVNAVFQESVRAYYSTWYRDLVTTMPRIEDGWIYPFDGPGLGTDLLPDLDRRPGAIVRKTTAKDL